MWVPESSLICPESQIDHGLTRIVKHFESVQVSSALRVDEHAHLSDFSWHIYVDRLRLIVLFTPLCLVHLTSDPVREAELEASDRMVCIVSLVYDFIEFDHSVSWELGELLSRWPLTVNWKTLISEWLHPWQF